MADTGLTSEFIHKLNEEKERYIAKLKNGHPKDFAAYQHVVGTIQGLESAERILHEVIQQYLEMQDDI